MPKKQNKKLIVIAVIVALLLIGGIFIFSKIRKNSANTEETTKSKTTIRKPVNVIPISERPYLKLEPHSSGHFITFSVMNVKKEAKSVFYEMEYMTGSMVQGFQGKFELTDLPAKDEKLFGSKSAGGAVTYHTDIKGGKIRTDFLGGADEYALKSEWKYFENTQAETEFSSADAKFQIAADSLATHPYLIIFNCSGYPDGLEKEVISEPYSVTSTKSLTGKAQLIMRTTEEDGDFVIMGWDGDKWQQFDPDEVEGKMVKAEVDLMEMYVVVKN